MVLRRLLCYKYRKESQKLIYFERKTMIMTIIHRLNVYSIQPTPYPQNYINSVNACLPP